MSPEFRDLPWTEVKRQVRQKLERDQLTLESCPLEDVPKIRGRIEALKWLLSLESGHNRQEHAAKPSTYF